MAAQQFDGELLPEATVTALMTVDPEDQVGGMRIARFTQAAKDAILSHLPAGATYTEGGGDFEEFRWDGGNALVLIDEDRLVAAGIEWDANTPENTLKQNIIILGEGQDPNASLQTLLQAMNLAVQDVAPVDVEMAGGRRKRRKTKKRKTAKRKTLRRRK